MSKLRGARENFMNKKNLILNELRLVKERFATISSQIIIVHSAGYCNNPLTIYIFNLKIN